jgi:hypothetical protein
LRNLSKEKRNCHNWNTHANICWNTGMWNSILKRGITACIFCPIPKMLGNGTPWRITSSKIGCCQTNRKKSWSLKNEQKWKKNSEKNLCNIWTSGHALKSERKSFSKAGSEPEWRKTSWRSCGK